MFVCFSLFMAKKKKVNFKKIDYVKLSIYIVPVVVLLFVLYMNFLPFGYSKTIVLDVGSSSDASEEFKVGDGFGPRQMFEGQSFRSLEGFGSLVFSPLAVLREAEIEIELISDGVYFPLMPDVSTVDWDYDFISILNEFEVRSRFGEYNYITSHPSTSFRLDENYALLFEFNLETEGVLSSGSLEIMNFASRFYVTLNGEEHSFRIDNFSQGQESSLLFAFDGSYHVFFDKEKVLEFEGDILREGFDFAIPVKTFSGFDKVEARAIVNEETGCVVFDGETRLVLPNTRNEFQDEPFSVYIEWIPKSTESWQQIIGHFNWEILQYDNRIRFLLGRTNVTDSFFEINYRGDLQDTKNNLLAVYNPDNEGNGTIELYINGIYVGETNINNEFLRQDYNNDLSLGWTPHNFENSPHFIGEICSAKFIYTPISAIQSKNESFIYEGPEDLVIPVYGSGDLFNVRLNIR